MSNIIWSSRKDLISSDPNFEDLVSKLTVREKLPTDLILMCKDKEVFDIDKEEVINEFLMPGMMKKFPSKETFMDWMSKRYSEKSNTFSRQLRAYVFGQGNRTKINLETKALSLSDCYWLKHKNEGLSFANISPYYSNFWKGEGPYEGGSIPTLYVNGYLPKKWLDKNRLFKSKEKHEVLCAEICEKLKIPVAKVEDYEDGIIVHNFTTANVMFEPAECSGFFDPEDFSTSDLFRTLEGFAYDMLFVDALVGNGDRHAGNFGFLRDANTGIYLSPAPLFDFDHAFGSKTVPDALIKEVNGLSRMFKTSYQVMMEKAVRLKLDTYLQKRLEALTV